MEEKTCTNLNSCEDSSSSSLSSDVKSRDVAASLASEFKQNYRNDDDVDDDQHGCFHDQQRPASLCRVDEIETDETEVWIEHIGQICHASNGQGKPCKLLPYLFVGSYIDAGDVMKLKLLGISAVVNCCAGQVSLMAHYAGKMECLEIAAEDTDDYDILQHIDQVREFVDKAKSGGGRVLIHCFAGQNRSVALAVAYAAARTRQPLLKLIETVAKDRRWILNNISFRKQLILWARHNNIRLC